MTNRHAQVFLNPDQVEHCLELWQCKKFDTVDISQFLRVPEPAVVRTIHAARAISREMQRS